jgi:hypothetical protein
MKSLYIILLALCFQTAFSQDKIYKKGGEIIEVKITEVGTDEIKYKIFNDQNGPVYSLDKDRILKVIYQNGRSENYQSNLKDPELYEDQSKNALKINFLAPLLGYTQLNFEHNLQPGRGYELSLGIIGLGKRQELERVYSANSQPNTTRYREAKGLFLGGGYKFSKLPDFVNKGVKYTHVLQGTYVKPEVILGLYGQNNIRSTQGDKETIAFGGLLINLGKQLVLGDALLLDIYGGLGYALDNRSNEQTTPEYYYNDYVGNHFALITGEDTGLGITGGLKIGLLLNKKK